MIPAIGSVWIDPVNHGRGVVMERDAVKVVYSNEEYVVALIGERLPFVWDIVSFLRPRIEVK